MKNAGRSVTYVFDVWTAIAVISALSSIAGFVIFKNVSPDVIAGTTAVAAGAILAMLSDTMMPEAYEEARDGVGLITVIGFLAAFILTKIG